MNLIFKSLTITLRRSFLQRFIPRLHDLSIRTIVNIVLQSSPPDSSTQEFSQHTSGTSSLLGSTQCGIVTFSASLTSNKLGCACALAANALPLPLRSVATFPPQQKPRMAQLEMEGLAAWRVERSGAMRGTVRSGYITTRLSAICSLTWKDKGAVFIVENSSTICGG